ncbi:asparagine--tRNA ligase [Verrucomicrobiales bacterium]|jgi:asparaginyl-tRNA synthetase|nr:asparagine--tRNA ligase [Verrucomicrobiales bacterium]MDB3940688.1 asparagine--tRNA ligase [Verrucomicrobiales bacterium]
MTRTPIAQILSSEEVPDSVLVQGWVRTKRDSKAFSFIELNDGSCLSNLQIVADAVLPEYEDAVLHLTTGASVSVKGKIVPSEGKGQKWEMQATEVTLLGLAEEDFPLQKKGHSMEFLRSIAHLRPRSNLFGAVFRVRSRMAYAIHQFFHDRGFFWVHTPIITASDCEGAGEMFRVVTMDGDEIKLDDDEFFGKPSYLTVSGQLEGETFATALSNIYTFGPTFRAENSHTSRHASEFWMIEPEIAFCDLEGDMDLAEEMLKYLANDALENCAEDLNFFNRFVDKGLIQRLEFVRDRDFQRISYTDAVELLKESGEKFEYPVEYGLNLQSEHERYLTETHFKCPTTVFNYPTEIKPFYMRKNDDGKTVAAMDLLVPGIGEIVGGSQREERLELLRENMAAHDLDEADYNWYVDLRRYGTVPHAGFGLGFERLLMFVTGVTNIRDVIPFPRTPGSAEF